MPALMRIDQAGLGNGSPGLAREDGLATGALVTLTSLVPGATNHFELLDVPEADTTAASSLVALSGGPQATWSFSPTSGVRGAYRIRLVTDVGQPTQAEQIRIFGIGFPTTGLVPPALNESGDPTASLSNSGAQQVANTERNTGGSVRGWLRFLYSLASTVDGLASSILPGYAHGMNLFWTSSTVLGADVGCCADSTNAKLITFGSAKTCTTTVAGAGGLDSASSPVSALTWYAIYSIWGSGPGAALLASTSFSSPTLPAGYTHRRRIGTAQTDSGSHWWQFYQSGNDGTRDYRWLGPMGVLSGGASGSLAVVDLSASVPKTAVSQSLAVKINSGPASASLAPVSTVSPVTAVLIAEFGSSGVAFLDVPTDPHNAIDATSVQKVKYSVSSGTVDIGVQGWREHI